MKFHGQKLAGIILHLGDTMRKAVGALLVLFLCVANFGFATDVGTATPDVTETTGTSEEPVLFDLGVGEELNDDELYLVDGEGIFGAIGGFIVGAITGAVGWAAEQAVEGTIKGGIDTEPKDLVRGLVISMSLTGLTGAVKGGLFSGPF